MYLEKKRRIRTDAVCCFNSLKILPLMLSGPQVLCILILYRSFCTPGRDIWECCVCAVGDVVLWFHSEYRLSLFIEDAGFLCQLWSVHHSSLVWYLCEAKNFLHFKSWMFFLQKSFIKINTSFRKSIGQMF